MARGGLKLSINPAVLRWARESAGYTQAEAAVKVGQSLARLQAWEAGSDQPTEPQLEKLASAYKRPLAVFFMQAEPEAETLPEDFRRVPGVDALPYTPKLRLAARRAKRIQRLTGELEAQLGIERPQLPDWRVHPPESPRRGRRAHPGAHAPAAMG